MRVRDIMSSAIHSCTPDTNLRDAARIMDQCDCGALPVVDSNNRNKAVGVITDRDIACRAVAQGKDPARTRVSECMSQPLATIEQDSLVDDCCQAMERMKVRRMLVVDGDGDLCGIVSQADIARRTGEEQTAEVVREISEPMYEASLVNSGA